MKGPKVHWSKKYPGAFSETDCYVKINGLPFSSQGAYLVPFVPGIDEGLVGTLYLYRKLNGDFVGTWAKKFLTKLYDVKEFKGPRGDRRMTFRFKWRGRDFSGVWYEKDEDVVHVKESSIPLRFRRFMKIPR
jgi:hypothetical protein